MANNLLEETQNNFHTLTNLLIKKNLTITTMESCTSGIVASFITDTDNSSLIFKGSSVTYANDAKIAQGVDPHIIEKYGVYSSETSIDMAKVAKKNFNSDIAIGITGSLGIVDSNNSDSKPGEVFFTIDYLKPISYSIKMDSLGSKFLNKIYVANCVCLELLKLLKD